MYYSLPVTLDSPIWNNTFAYDERVNVLGEAKIIVPQLIEWMINDVRRGTNIVFAEMIDDELQEFQGLESLVCLDYPSAGHWEEKKVYIMDNHNHALYFWYREYRESNIKKWLPVIHIDQHSDMKEPLSWIAMDREDDLEYIAQYTNEVCTIADFIHPWLKTWIIDKCIQLRTENGLLDYNIPEFSYILDIDIDFWAPEMRIEQFDRTIQKTRQLIAEASLVTIATSPCFIDQERALDIVDLLIK